MTEKQFEETLLRLNTLIRQKKSRWKKGPLTTEAIASIKAYDFVLSVIQPDIERIMKKREVQAFKEQNKNKRYVAPQYNKLCLFYAEIDGESYCQGHMDLTFCTRDCAWAKYNNKKF